MQENRKSFVIELSSVKNNDKYQFQIIHVDFHHANSFIFAAMHGLQLSDLSIYHKRLEIIRATADQIIKDFEVFGETIEISGSAETAYNELKSEIFKIVSDLINVNFQKFISLLYRIDLNEKTVKELLKKPSVNFAEMISEMIIERELKKVILRDYFRSKQ